MSDMGDRYMNHAGGGMYGTGPVNKPDSAAFGSGIFQSLRPGEVAVRPSDEKYARKLGTLLEESGWVIETDESGLDRSLYDALIKALTAPEHTNPKEPTVLGSVVMTRSGVRWVHIGSGKWMQADGGNGKWTSYDSLDVAEIIT